MSQDQKPGPKTTEGKARSSRNSLKHGLFAKNVILNCEEQPEFDALLNGYVAEYNPSTPVENTLVHEIAASRWRLERIEGIETALFNSILEEHHEATGDPDPYAGLATAFTPGTAASASLQRIHLYEGRLRRAHEKAVRALREHRATASIPALPEQPKPVPAPKPAPKQDSFFQACQDLKDPSFAVGHLVDKNGKLIPEVQKYVDHCQKLVANVPFNFTRNHRAA